MKIPVKEEVDTSVSDDVYVVKSGDTLYSIARRYNTKVDAIKAYNNLTSNTLTIGSILQIPIATVDTTYQTYTITSGDTLYAIARRFNTTVDDILSINDLTVDSKITVEGQFRSYNSYENERNKLVLTVFAKDIKFMENQEEDIEVTKELVSNEVILNGYDELLNKNQLI